MLRNFLILAVCGMSMPVFAVSKVSGLVRVTKATAGRYVNLESAETKKIVRLCDSPLSNKIQTLSAMTLEVSGDWKGPEGGKTSCFDSREFKILKLSSGREPAVGVLKIDKSAYYLEHEDGQRSVFLKVPKSMKKMLNKKIIVDPKIVAVSYSVYPE
ncbi:MAG: hypothetical protein HRU09_05640 [Oligoflexales bacterium]|nr:hypothetical protein [Oligoflexales bacterium]